MRVRVSSFAIKGKGNKDIVKEETEKESKKKAVWYFFMGRAPADSSGSGCFLLL